MPNLQTTYTLEHALAVHQHAVIAQVEQIVNIGLPTQEQIQTGEEDESVGQDEEEKLASKYLDSTGFEKKTKNWE